MLPSIGYMLTKFADQACGELGHTDKDECQCKLYNPRAVRCMWATNFIECVAEMRVLDYTLPSNPLQHAGLKITNDVYAAS